MTLSYSRFALAGFFAGCLCFSIVSIDDSIAFYFFLCSSMLFWGLFLVASEISECTQKILDKLGEK